MRKERSIKRLQDLVARWRSNPDPPAKERHEDEICQIDWDWSCKWCLGDLRERIGPEAYETVHAIYRRSEVRRIQRGRRPFPVLDVLEQQLAQWRIAHEASRLNAEEQERSRVRRNAVQLNALAAEATLPDAKDSWGEFRDIVGDAWSLESWSEVRHLMEPETWTLVEQEVQAIRKHREDLARARQEQEAQERARRVAIRRSIWRELRSLEMQGMLHGLPSVDNAAQRRLRQTVYTLLDSYGLEEVRNAITSHIWDRIVWFVTEWASTKHPPTRYSHALAPPSNPTIFAQPPQLPATYTYLAEQRKQRARGAAKVPGGPNARLTLAQAAQYVRVSPHTIQAAVDSGTLESCLVLATGERYVRKLWVNRWRRETPIIVDADDDDEDDDEQKLLAVAGGEPSEWLSGNAQLDDEGAELLPRHDEAHVPVIAFGEDALDLTLDCFSFVRHPQKRTRALRVSASNQDWIQWLRINQHDGLADLVDAVYVQDHNETAVARELGVPNYRIARCLSEARYLFERSRIGLDRSQRGHEPQPSRKEKVDGRRQRGDAGLQRILAALENWLATYTHAATFVALQEHLGETSRHGLQERLRKLMIEGRVEKGPRGAGYRFVRWETEEKSA